MLGKTILRSSGIGAFIGTLPGAGGTIAAFVSYNEAKCWSKEPEKFGTGVFEGVAAPEAANNAGCGGAMIPMLTLGIPGSATTAIMLGAMIIHGIRPGPYLFSQNANVVHTLFAAMFIANFLVLFLGVYGAKLFAHATLIPYKVLAPIVLVLASIGSFAIRGSAMDLSIMFGAGLLGYMMMNNGFPVAPLILGLILGPIAEGGLRRALIISGGSFIPILTKPLVIVLLILSLVSFASPFFREKSKVRRNRR